MLENHRIHAIDTYLHGKRRPIANAIPARHPRGRKGTAHELHDAVHLLAIDPLTIAEVQAAHRI